MYESMNWYAGMGVLMMGIFVTACSPQLLPSGDAGSVEDTALEADAASDTSSAEDTSSADTSSADTSDATHTDSDTAESGDCESDADCSPGFACETGTCVASSDECASLAARSVHLVGDSTVASGSGWGDFLGNYLAAEASVTNSARSGTSSKSFYDGDFDAVRSQLASGDFLLIQFGHNDAKPEEYRRTEPGSAPEYDGSYRAYLERYIDESRAAGATPVLITSVSRMVFDSAGNSRRTHGEYPAAMRRVALDHDVTLLDLEEHSFQVFDSLGESRTLDLYAEANGSDRTHFPPDKAFRITEMVVELLEASTSELRCYVAR